MVKTKSFAKMKNGLLAKLFGAAVLSVGLIALAGTKAMATNEVEDNNRSSRATEINVNEEASGNLSSIDDIDWYKFTLTEPGTVSLTFEHEETENSPAMYSGWELKLFDDDEERVTYIDQKYAGPARVSTTDSYNLAQGTYYVKIIGLEYYVECPTSVYSLTANFESSVGKDMEKESNDSISNANTIETGNEYTGQLRLASDIDWYKFTLTEPGTVSITFEHEETENSPAMYSGWGLNLFADEEEKVSYIEKKYAGPAKKSTTNSYNLPKGTYYIKVYGIEYYEKFSPSAYSLTTNFESSAGKDMEQESNDTPSTANLISVNKNYSGRVSLEKDLDWYVFDLSESSTVTVTLSHDVIDSSSWYWNVCVYDNAEMTNELLNCHWVGNKEKQTSETEIKAGAGRYYMVVKKDYWSDANYNVCVNATPAGKKTMLRLYNPNSGEHFYTASEREKNALVAQGWSFEGKAWDAPEFSNTPVYRLYNKNSGDHHYTPNKKERDNLVKQGWKDEGIGWYSDDSKKVPLYRLYNPNAVAGSHHYTTSARERDNLVKQGWKDENIGWYGL